MEIIENPYARLNLSNRSLPEAGCKRERQAARATTPDEVSQLEPRFVGTSSQSASPVTLPERVNACVSMLVGFSHLWVSVSAYSPVFSLCFWVFLWLCLWNRILLRCCCCTLPRSTPFLLPLTHHHHHRFLLVFYISSVHATTIPCMEKYPLPGHCHYPHSPSTKV